MPVIAEDPTDETPHDEVSRRLLALALPGLNSDARFDGWKAQACRAIWFEAPALQVFRPGERPSPSSPHPAPWVLVGVAHLGSLYSEVRAVTPAGRYRARLDPGHSTDRAFLEVASIAALLALLRTANPIPDGEPENLPLLTSLVDDTDRGDHTPTTAAARAIAAAVATTAPTGTSVVVEQTLAYMPSPTIRVSAADGSVLLDRGWVYTDGDVRRR